MAFFELSILRRTLNFESTMMNRLGSELYLSLTERLGAFLVGYIVKHIDKSNDFYLSTPFHL